MARPRQPIELLEIKGKKHLTQDEIKKRKSEQVKASNDDVSAPDYLTKQQSKKFNAFTKQLLDIGIISNLDCDSLARYIQSQEKYEQYDDLVNSFLSEITSTETAIEYMAMLEKAENLRDKALKQCRSSASDLGLTISSRCRLVVPKKEEKEESDPMAKLLAMRG